MKKYLVIGVIILIVVLLWINRDYVKLALGIEKTKGDDHHSDEIGAVQINNVQSAIDDLLKKQAVIVAEGSSDTKEFEEIQKKIQILKLEQKTGVKFNQKLLKDLLKLSIVELMSFNDMSNEELMNYANAWNDENGGGGTGTSGSNDFDNALYALSNALLLGYKVY